MADRIMVMNHGVIEQLVTPREIYDRPATMFVADFVGSPAMSFLPFDGPVRQGQRQITIDGVQIDVPGFHEAAGEEEFMLGFRPEHVSFLDSSKLRGTVFGTEYLGTTQIVTINTQLGQIKARVAADQHVRTGENIGLALRAERLAVFDGRSGRALDSELYEAGHG